MEHGYSINAVLLWSTVERLARVAFYLLYFLTAPIVSEVTGRHIRYISPHFFTTIVMIFYVIATCISSLVSSHGTVKALGLAALVPFLTAGAIYSTWLISVWCFFAAGLSSLGIPEDSVLQYEAALKADSFLLVAHGPTDEMARAKTILDSASPTRIDLHRDVNDMPELAPVLSTRDAVAT